MYIIYIIYISSFCQDRWHSAAWRDAMDRRQQIPTENRALINPQLSGQNCGSTLEILGESLESLEWSLSSGSRDANQKLCQWRARV